MRKVIHVVAATAALGACAAPGPAFVKPTAAVPDGQARLFVFNTGSALTHHQSVVSLDGQTICFLAGDEVMVRDIPPGQHKLSVDTPMSPGVSVLPFTAEPGKPVYIEAAKNGRAMAAVGLFGVFGVLGSMAASDHETPRGGALVLEQAQEEPATKTMASMAACACKKDGS